jgi:hypothetical protein
VYVDDQPNSARNRWPGLNLKTQLFGSGRTKKPPKPGNVTLSPALKAWLSGE